MNAARADRLDLPALALRLRDLAGRGGGRAPPPWLFLRSRCAGAIGRSGRGPCRRPRTAIRMPFTKRATISAPTSRSSPGRSPGDKPEDNDMDSFTFTLGKDAIEIIGEALDTAPLARRRTNPVVAMMQEQIIAQQGEPAPRKTRRKPASQGEAAAPQAPAGG